MIETVLEDGHVWLRIVRPHYTNPFDPSHAQERGGRWNPPRSWPTLSLNHDLPTVHAQVLHLFVDRGIDPDDLNDDAPILLAAATLPARQGVADLTCDEGLTDVGLPTSYPLHQDGLSVSREVTQQVGKEVRDAGLHGVFCRSAATLDGSGRELAWFPSARGHARAVWPRPLGFGRWRHARTIADIRAREGRR